MAITTLFVIIVTSTVIFSTTTSATTSTTSPAASLPSSPPTPISTTGRPPTNHIATILSTLGFYELATATTNLSTTTTTATTIFAPTTTSLLTCPTCSLPLLLQEHSLPGLYPLHFLRSLPFGTKIETLASSRCLTITSTTTSTAIASKKVFINGVEITKPDLFNNGLIIVHGIQGFVSHLSPTSCTLETMTTLSFPHSPPPLAAFLVKRSLLKDTMTRLQTSGFSIVGLAMRVKYPALSELRTMTLFALDDDSVFSSGEGHAYVRDLRFHIVPNRLITAADMAALPVGTVLPTMERGRYLVVTSSGDGGPLTPVRINYVRVKSFGLVENSRIVVHVLYVPFRHVDTRMTGYGLAGNPRFGVPEMVAPPFFDGPPPPPVENQPPPPVESPPLPPVESPASGKYWNRDLL